MKQIELTRLRVAVWVFYLLFFIEFLMLVLASRPWASPKILTAVTYGAYVFGAILILYLFAGLFLYFLFLMKSWWEMGIVAGLPLVVLLVLMVLIPGYIASHRDSLRQAASSVLGLIILTAPLVLSVIKFLFITGGAGVAIYFVNAAILKVNRALDSVIRSQEMLERIEQKLLELKLDN